MKNYTEELREALLKTEVTDNGGKKNIADNAVLKIVNLILARKEKGNKVILIGNGGSASIASHIVTDLLKNAGIPAIAFNDPSLITCLTNDLGYEHVFSKPIEMLAKKGDVLFSISSSGKSKNILNAAGKAKEMGCFVITLSGFSPDNPLRKMGDLNFYTPSYSYGYVEIAHLTICHSIADKIMEANSSDG